MNMRGSMQCIGHGHVFQMKFNHLNLFEKNNSTAKNPLILMNEPETMEWSEIFNESSFSAICRMEKN